MATVNNFNGSFVFPYVPVFMPYGFCTWRQLCNPTCTLYLFSCPIDWEKMWGVERNGVLSCLVVFCMFVCWYECVI